MGKSTEGLGAGETPVSEESLQSGQKGRWPMRRGGTGKKAMRAQALSMNSTWESISLHRFHIQLSPAGKSLRVTSKHQQKINLTHTCSPVWEVPPCLGKL